MNKDENTWDDLYWRWKNSCEVLDSNITDEPSFLPVERKYKSLDWWPKNTIPDRKDPLSRPGYVTVWETKAGTLNTAEMIWEAKGDLQKQHAIFILASLWDKKKDLPEQWRGNGFRLIEKSERIIRERFPEIGRWHHASREALPINITGYVYSDRMLVPEDYKDLMYIAAIEFTLTVANWQLIEYVTSR